MLRSSMSPQVEPESAAAQRMEEPKSLSSPPSAKGLRSRRAMENLVAENSRLRAEMESIMSQQADVQGRMVTDLVNTKSELRANNLENSSQRESIANQSTELQKLRQNVASLSGELQDARLVQSDTQESTKLRQTIDRLTTEMREKDLHHREKDQLLREREFELRTTGEQLKQEQTQREKEEIEIQNLQSMINNQRSNEKTGVDDQIEIERSKTENFSETSTSSEASEPASYHLTHTRDRW